MLWAVLGQPSPLARARPQPLSWLGCPACAKPQHHGDSGTCSWSFSFMIFSKFSHGGLTLHSSKQHQAHHRCCRMFRRSFCGSWHRTEGHGGVHEQLEVLNPVVHKHFLCTEGHTKYSMEDTDAWRNDHRQLQVSNPHSAVSGDTAASKTCLAAAWGTPAGSAPANTHTETHCASQCQDCVLFQGG